MLTQISDEVGKVFDTNESLTSANATLTADNDKLRGYNMELFQRVGSPKEKPENKPNTEGLKYSDLFNEKGDLK